MNKKKGSVPFLHADPLCSLYIYPVLTHTRVAHGPSAHQTQSPPWILELGRCCLDPRRGPTLASVSCFSSVVSEVGPSVLARLLLDLAQASRVNCAKKAGTAILLHSEKKMGCTPRAQALECFPAAMRDTEEWRTKTSSDGDLAAQFDQLGSAWCAGSFALGWFGCAGASRQGAHASGRWVSTFKPPCRVCRASHVRHGALHHSCSKCRAT